MPTFHDRAYIAVLIENQIPLLSKEFPQSVEQISDLVALLPSVVNRFHKEQFLQVIKDLFQFNKLISGENFSRGFPGVVLTAAIGKILEPKFNPSKNFYSCNPRAIFEKNIRPILGETYNAPMGKSDPLNVAKNINVIDENWAKGKRPEYAARAAVTLISYISTANEKDVEELISILVYVYITLGKIFFQKPPVLNYNIDLLKLFQILKNLITDIPAGGETAQTVFGAILQAQHNLFHLTDCLFGVGESVFSTNTTSKKPGDFQEVFNDFLHVYEITTKKVDQQRLEESGNAVFDFLVAVGESIKNVEITFLCRPEDVKIDLVGKLCDESSLLSCVSYKNLNYSFVDLWEWMICMLDRIGSIGRKNAVELIDSEIKKTSTRADLKLAWADIISTYFSSGNFN